MKNERLFLNTQRIKSRDPNEELFFFEIDSMDQNKTKLPHSVNNPKNLNPDYQIDFHVTVVKYVCSRWLYEMNVECLKLSSQFDFHTCCRYNGTRPDDVYYYPDVVAHDTATTCTFIWMILLKV